MGLLLDAIDWFVPPRCWVCGEGVPVARRPDDAAPLACDAHAVAAGLVGARCGVCAGPLPDGIADGARCADCRRTGRPFSRTVAALDYADAAARDWVLAFKHGGRADLAPPLARLVAEAARRASGPLGPRDRLVPVPLHRARLLDRGHDQAARLAVEIGRATGALVAPVLRRSRATAPQGAAVAPARHANVRGAFRVVGGRIPTEARVWLVDDVMTSCATAAECARALKRSGAGSVGVLVALRARVGAETPSAELPGADPANAEGPDADRASESSGLQGRPDPC